MEKIIIEGVVSKVDGQFRAWLEVEVEVPGLSYPKRYTVKAKESRYNVGERIHVEGQPGVKPFMKKDGTPNAAIVIWQPEITPMHTVDEVATTLMAAGATELDNNAPF